MREPPFDLTTDELKTCLQEQYDVAVAEITFLPLGHDSLAWVYRVETDNQDPLFLKVRTSIANLPGLLVPRYLQDYGVQRLIPPLRTVHGTLWADVGSYVTILYPFVAGVTGMDHGMSDRQWVEYGAALRQIHEAPVTSELERIMRRESFVSAGVPVVERVDAELAAQGATDELGHEVVAFWTRQRDQIEMLLGRADDLGRRLEQAALPLVLCHADIHTNNVLLDDTGQLWIVDWDETMLAPRERDLMFAIGGISAKLVGRREEALFLEGYGELPISNLALAYYRYAWALSDIGAYAEEVILRPDLGTLSRRAALDSLIGLFEPGEIVALALASPLDES